MKCQIVGAAMMFNVLDNSVLTTPEGKALITAALSFDDSDARVRISGPDHHQVTGIFQRWLANCSVPLTSKQVSVPFQNPSIRPTRSTSLCPLSHSTNNVVMSDLVCFNKPACKSMISPFSFSQLRYQCERMCQLWTINY